MSFIDGRVVSIDEQIKYIHDARVLLNNNADEISILPDSIDILRGIETNLITIQRLGYKHPELFKAAEYIFNKAYEMKDGSRDFGGLSDNIEDFHNAIEAYAGMHSKEGITNASAMACLAIARFFFTQQETPADFLKPGTRVEIQIGDKTIEIVEGTIITIEGSDYVCETYWGRKVQVPFNKVTKLKE